MKKIISLTIALAFAQITFAQKADLRKISANGSALVQIAAGNLAGKDATKLINKILIGQSYEERVSIISTKCKTVNKTMTQCEVVIGTDNLNDDDSGWGFVQGLNYLMDSKGRVQAATLVGIAG